MSKNPEKKAVMKIITRLDNEQATYQELHRNYYGHDDERAKHFHRRVISIIEEVITEIKSEKL